MTTPIENRNIEKNEIKEILKILSNEKFFDKKTVSKIKNEILSAYYSNYFNNEKLKVDNTKDRELEKINKQIISIGKRIDKIEEELGYTRLRNITRLGFSNPYSKRILNNYKLILNNRTLVYNSIKAQLSKKIFNGIFSKINKIQSNRRKMELDENKLLLKEYKKLKQKKIQLIETRKTLIETDKENHKGGNIKKKYNKKINTLKDYINNNPESLKMKILKRVDGANIRENKQQKERIKNLIRNSTKKNILNEGDEVYKMAKSLELYLSENFGDIINKIDGIQEKIRVKETERQDIIPKGESSSIENIIELKEREYNLQLEIIKLKNEYDELRLNIDEKLKAYDGSTFEEKKEEFLKNRNIFK